jgi:hypothetical protein
MTGTQTPARKRSLLKLTHLTSPKYEYKLEIKILDSEGLEFTLQAVFLDLASWLRFGEVWQVVGQWLQLLCLKEGGREREIMTHCNSSSVLP